MNQFMLAKILFFVFSMLVEIASARTGVHSFFACDHFPSDKSQTKLHVALGNTLQIQESVKLNASNVLTWNSILRNVELEFVIENISASRRAPDFLFRGDSEILSVKAVIEDQNGRKIAKQFDISSNPQPYVVINIYSVNNQLEISNDEIQGNEKTVVNKLGNFFCMATPTKLKL